LRSVRGRLRRGRPFEGELIATLEDDADTQAAFGRIERKDLYASRPGRTIIDKFLDPLH